MNIFFRFYRHGLFLSMTIVTAVVNLVRQVASCEDKTVEYLHKLKLLIEKVVVYGEDEIEIMWKMDDPFARIKGQ